MLILLTNDDGINSEGLRHLREALLKDGHEVYVVAPDRERTCTAHAITLHKPLRIHRLDDRLFSTNGTPADCVVLGVRFVIGRKPDLVISGINGGPNMGQDVYYSGTVAAAREAALIGIQSFAVSIDARENFRYADAITVIREIIERIHKKAIPGGIFLNVNIPNRPFNEMKGFMVTRLGLRIYNDEIIERVDPRGRKYYWIGGGSDNFRPEVGTDFMAVKEGYISITPMDTHIPESKARRTIEKIFGRWS